MGHIDTKKKKQFMSKSNNKKNILKITPSKDILRFDLSGISFCEMLNQGKSFFFKVKNISSIIFHPFISSQNPF